MGVRAADKIAQQLVNAGADAHTAVDLACNVSTQQERHIQTSIKDLAQTIGAHGITGTTLILVRFPKKAKRSSDLAA